MVYVSVAKLLKIEIEARLGLYELGGRKIRRTALTAVVPTSGVTRPAIRIIIRSGAGGRGEEKGIV